MHDHDDNPDGLGDDLLDDLGQWRREHPPRRLHAQRSGMPPDDDDVQRLPPAEREQLLARIVDGDLSGSRASGDIGEEPPPPDEPIERNRRPEATESATLPMPASSASAIAMISPPPPPVPWWHKLLSHGLVAATAAGLTALFVIPSAPSIDELQPPDYGRATLVGSSAEHHLGKSEQAGSCLHGVAQLRLDRETDARPEAGPLEVVVRATDEEGQMSATTLREGDRIEREPSGALLFEGPLSALGPDHAGHWTLDVQAGRPGACGGEEPSGCTRLPTLSVLVIVGSGCDESR